MSHPSSRQEIISTQKPVFFDASLWSGKPTGESSGGARCRGRNPSPAKGFERAGASRLQTGPAQLRLPRTGNSGRRSSRAREVFGTAATERDQGLGKGSFDEDSRGRTCTSRLEGSEGRGPDGFGRERTRGERGGERGRSEGGRGKGAERRQGVDGTVSHEEDKMGAG